MKNIGAHVGYTVLWDRVSNGEKAELQMCYYPAAPPLHVIVVLTGTRVVRVLWVLMAAHCCVDTCVCVGVAAECARLRLAALDSAFSKRCMSLIMLKRQDCAESVSASSNDLNMQ